MSRFHRNTWAVADELINSMLDGQNGGPEHLADLTSQFEAAYKVSALSEFFEPNHFEDNYPDPWSAFHASLQHGMPVTPRISLAVSHCIDFYSRKGGSVSYEDVFHGGLQVRVGNHAKANFKHNAYQEFHEWVTCLELSKVKTPSQVALAQRFVALTPGLGDPDTFLRGYRRWKEANL